MGSKVFLLILIFLPIHLFGQTFLLSEGDKTFLPEMYVKSILSTHRLKEVHGFREQPIEAILVKSGKIYLRTYGGKETPASLQKNHSGQWEILHVKKLLNLKYFFEDDFKTTRFFIDPSHGSLSLEIVDHNNRKSIQFISSVKGYHFEDPRFAYIRLLLSGSYQLSDGTNKSKVVFNLDGSISNHQQWNKFIIDHVYMFTNGQEGNFHSIKLISNENKSHRNLVFRYNPATNSWAGFNFNVVKGNAIALKKEKSIKLIRQI